MKISAIIPSAGRSARMGAFKPLLPFGSTTLIDQAVANAAHTCVEIIIVGGYHAGDLANYVTQDRGQSWLHQVRVVENEQWERGMLSSIQRGAREVNGEFFFVAPADMPYLSPEIYGMLASRPPRYALFPEHEGRKGHPVLISAEIIPELLRITPAEHDVAEAQSHGEDAPGTRADFTREDAASEQTSGQSPKPYRSMRQFLASYPTETCQVDTDAIFADIDTLEEYGAARAGRHPS